MGWTAAAPQLTLLACPIVLRTLAPLTLQKGNERLGMCTRARGSCGSNRRLEKTTTRAWRVRTGHGPGAMEDNKGIV